MINLVIGMPDPAKTSGYRYDASLSYSGSLWDLLSQLVPLLENGKPKGEYSVSVPEENSDLFTLIHELAKHYDHTLRVIERDYKKGR